MRCDAGDRSYTALNYMALHEFDHLVETPKMYYNYLNRRVDLLLLAIIIIIISDYFNLVLGNTKKKDEAKM